MPARLLAHGLSGVRRLLAAQARGWLRGGREEVSRGWSARPTGRRAVAIAALAGLAAAALGSLAAQVGRPDRLPGPLDWSAAAALLARDARPGDAVLLAPPWLERAREVAPHGIPVIAAARPGDEPLPGVTRAWLLAAPDASRAALDAEAALAQRAARSVDQRLGALEVVRFDLAAPVLPLGTLAERARPPAAAALREAGGLPRRCLVVTPAPGEPLVLPFPATRLGASIAGHAALLPGPGDAPVRIAFQVDGAEAGAVEVGPGDAWLPFQVDTASGPHDLALVVTTPGAAARPVCLEALLLP